MSVIPYTWMQAAVAVIDDAAVVGVACHFPVLLGTRNQVRLQADRAAQLVQLASHGLVVGGPPDATEDDTADI